MRCNAAKKNKTILPHHLFASPVSQIPQYPRMPYDLFGEIPVTEDDLYAWVAAIAPTWLTPERSYRYYVENWNVAGKVRAAKLAGTFAEIASRPREPWHARLALAAII